MKKSFLISLVLLPVIVGCSSPSNVEDTNSNVETDTKVDTNTNVKTRNYKNIKSEELHFVVDDGYVRISNALINSEHFIEVEEDITYLYKLSCKNKTDSFQIHRVACDSDGYYYAEINDEQHSMIPNGFDVLKNSNHSGSSVEILIEEIYECITYRELYYSETEQKIKVVDFDHVIPGLEESEVNSLVGKSVDYYVYVDENGIKTLNHGNLPFTSELIINYIDVSEIEIQIGKY